ncbi:mediator of RNA polymerase II transcription subunit 6-like isoform X1 [Castanea sativa]|uniref:mediator of RNA polymerase II transcription subunit 6-like isoform X1 n=1 Tax=Castanea sativa TaxID=21020 RepID=UPI003F64E169
MTGICFKDQLWLNTYPLDRNLVFDYFALSPFYDWTCNNEQLRMRSIHPLDLSHLSIMNFESDGKGANYPGAQSRSLYHISKAFTIAASKLEKIGCVDADESAALKSKVAKETIDFKEVKRIDHILASLQRKVSVWLEVRYIFKECKFDCLSNICTSSLFGQLPPAPLPPLFPEGYVPPANADTEKAPEVQQSGEVQPPSVDPIIDQGPAKRMKL